MASRSPFATNTFLKTEIAAMLVLMRAEARRNSGLARHAAFASSYKKFLAMEQRIKTLEEKQIDATG